MKLKLRPATMKDADFLLKLKNDPESLKWSWDHEPVSLQAHKNWLEKAIFYQEPMVYIAVVGTKRVGSIRRLPDYGGDQVSFTVAPKYRGRGYGTQMLKLLPHDNGQPFVAYIDLGNGRSLGAFIAAGYKLIVKAVKE